MHNRHNRQHMHTIRICRWYAQFTLHILIFSIVLFLIFSWLIQLFKILQQKSILNCFNQSVTCDANVKWSFNVICKRAKYLTIFLQIRNSKIEEDDGSNVRCKQWKPRRSFRSEQGEIFFTNKNVWIFVPVFYFEVSKVCQLLSMCLFHWRKNNGAFHCIQWSIH